MSKVLHIISSLQTGGAQRLLTRLLPAMMGDDIEPELLVYEDLDNEYTSQIKEAGIKIYSLNVSNFYAAGVVIKLRKFLKAHSYNAIHVHLFPSLYQVRIAAIGTRSRLIYTEHSTHNRRREYRMLRLVERWIYRGYDRIVAVSDCVAEAIRKWLGDDIRSKIRVIYNGVDVAQFRDRGRTGHDYEMASKEGIIMVSRFTRAKDQATLIRSIPYLEDKSIIVTFAGSGDTLKQCVSLAEELGVLHRCRFLGDVDYVASLVRRSRIGVLSSHWEGFPISLLEMMAGGLPVVASAVAGISGVADDAVIQFEEGDYRALASKINELNRDRKHYDKMRTKSIEAAQRYDIRKTAVQYIGCVKG